MKKDELLQTLKHISDSYFQKEDYISAGIINRAMDVVNDYDGVLPQADIILSLPSVDDAGVIAVNVASNVRPKLTAQEEAMFIAGFQECVKYLSGQEKGNRA